MVNVIKSFASKFCFCLGLGTACFYSYGEVKRWVAPEQVSVVENSVRKAVISPIQTIQAALGFSRSSEDAPMMMFPAGAPESSVPGEAASSVAVTEEKKDEEKKDDGEQKAGEENTEIATGVVGQPISNDPLAYSPTGPAPASENSAPVVETPVVGVLPSSSPSSSGSGNHSVGYSGAIASTDTLQSSDISALISPLKATFEDAMASANGMLCTSPEACEQQSNVPIHTLRWGTTQGLKKDVQFAIKSTGGTFLEFDFEFKVQNMALAEETATVSVAPSEVIVHNESKNSKSYRVFEFKFADLSVVGTSLKQVRAKMIYEITETGLVAQNTSKLSFVRSGVQVAIAPWDPLAGEPTDPSPSVLAGRIPAALQTAGASGTYLIADELSFSMNVEKSQ